MSNLAKYEKILLDVLSDTAMPVTELEDYVSDNISATDFHVSLHSLISKGLVKLDDNLNLVLSDSDNKDTSSNKCNLIRIDGGIEWRTDELLGWAFEQLEEFAQEGNMEAIAITVRYSDRSAQAVFEGGDLVGLAGAVAMLHNSIIESMQDN